MRKKWDTGLKLPAKIILFVVFSEVLLLWFFSVWNLWDIARQRVCPEQDENVCTKYVINSSIALIFSNFLLLGAVLDGIFFDNIYELYSAFLNATLATGYSIFKFIQKYENDSIDYIQMIYTIICLFIYICAAYPLHKEYKARTYAKAGSDASFIKIYGEYLLLMAFKKMDFIYTIMSVVLSGRGLFNIGWEAAIDVIMVLLAFANMFFGTYGFYYENKPCVYFYWIDFIPHPMYFGYHFYVIHTLGPFKYWTQTQQVTVVIFLVYASVACLSHIIALPVSIVAYRNFGKGLKKMEFVHDSKDRDLGTIN